MSSLIESEHHFNQRCAEVGLTPTTINALNRLDLKSLARLGYSVGQPGQPLPEATLASWLESNFGHATVGEHSALKRLIFEGQTLILAELKEQVTHPDRQTAKPVPAAERQRRMEILKARLVGLHVSESLEPGHALLDLAAKMEQENQIQFIPPEKCVSRLHEVMNVKTPTKIVELEASRLVVKEESAGLEQPASSALQLQDALRRRGLALVFAQSCSWGSYEKYVCKLFGHLARDPPPGMARCSVSQLAEADRQCWVRLIQMGISPRKRPDGTYPLDEELAKVLESYEVSFTLQPRLAKDAPSKRSGRGSGSDKKRQHVDNHTGHGKQKFLKPGGGKGAGREPRLPKEFVAAGAVRTTPDRSEICFGYSLNKCTAKDCKRAHVCAKCFGAHPLKEHK